MAIKVDSSQWTGESGDTRTTPVVWGEFADETTRDAAIARLRSEGTQRNGGTTDPDRPVDQPDEHPEEADLRNRRQLGVGVAMAASAMGAAGLVVASGGALLPAVAAAAAAGTGAGVAGEAVAAAVSDTPEEATRLPPNDAPLIGLRAPDEATQHAAETKLRELGAIRVIVDAD
ncbi:hypothetical protein HB662_16720 [Roseomonas frigidaquae]|uniref:SPOR domain-containing protein n=1 Tax=Falsiroseomonas frigidaquae TaxID=487318 RepID=A0ABX1F272_9PROT|nr:hypothetical protein [Falsiroseomonas frigidaquae]NKE46428.1 hypothetical protein [Falsiroseomonas frigidaquae]